MADNFMMKIPYFAKGKADSLERALTTGRFKDGLDKALYFFATDTHQWVLVDTDKTIHIITSYEGQPVPPGPGGEGGVKRVDELPPILEGDLETLYIKGDEVFSFNGHGYVSTTKDMEDKIGAVPEGATVIEYIDDVRDDTVEMAREYIANILDVHVMFD